MHTKALNLEALFRQITATIDLPRLLAILGEQLLVRGDLAGYAVYLLEEAGANLVCEKICLPEAHQGMERTLHKYKLPRSLPDANNECFSQQRMIRLNPETIGSFPEATKKRFNLWQLSDLAILPLTCGEEAIGTIMLLSQTGQFESAWLDQIAPVLDLFSHQIRNALSHARLKDREEEFLCRLREQESVHAFIKQINSLTSEDLVYDMIAREFLRRFGFEVAAVLMHGGAKLTLKKWAAISGKHDALLAELNAFCTRTRFAYDIHTIDGASASAFIRNSHLYFRDTMEVIHLPMSDKDRDILTILKTPRSFVCMPIRSEGKPIGILWLFSVDGIVELTEAELSTVEQLSSFVSTAIANAKLYSTINRQNIEIEKLNIRLRAQNEQLNELATRDRLTGLHNFGFFREALDMRLSECRRQKWKDPVALVIVDIDNFKLFNDTHGHQAGNLALVDIAARIRGLARQVDVVCRYGGEEFVVILPHCNLQGASQFAERLRTTVEATPVIIDKRPVPVTISAGCSECSHDEPASQFIERADAALYQAKQNGRNRVEIAAVQVLAAGYAPPPG
ncbi:MAG: diguanylate cyclase [Betaproteobacteria bacterium]